MRGTIVQRRELSDRRRPWRAVCDAPLSFDHVSHVQYSTVLRRVGEANGSRVPERPERAAAVTIFLPYATQGCTLRR